MEPLMFLIRGSHSHGTDASWTNSIVGIVPLV